MSIRASLPCYIQETVVAGEWSSFDTCLGLPLETEAPVMTPNGVDF